MRKEVKKILLMSVIFEYNDDVVKKFKDIKL